MRSIELQSSLRLTFNWLSNTKWQWNGRLITFTPIKWQHSRKIYRCFLFPLNFTHTPERDSVFLELVSLCVQLSNSFIVYATGRWEPVPESCTGLWLVWEVWISALWVRAGLYQTHAGHQPLQPAQVPPGPAALPGASPRGVQPGRPVLPLHQHTVRREEEEDHRALLLLPGDGWTATQLPAPAELLSPWRPLQVTPRQLTYCHEVEVF